MPEGESSNNLECPQLLSLRSSLSPPSGERYRLLDSAPAHRGVSDPVRPFGSCRLVHVPCGTNFQELPWKSTVEVPWHVVPGPAAQSF